MTIFGARISPFLLFLVVIVLIGALYANFVALPMMGVVAEVESSIDLNRGRIELLDQAIADEQNIRLEIAEFQTELARRGSIRPRSTVNARGAALDIFKIARETQSIVDDFRLGEAETVFGLVARPSDGARMYKTPITLVVRGTGSNASDDVEDFLKRLEDRTDAAYFVDGFTLEPQPDPIGTPIRPSMRAEGPKVTIAATLYYYGFPEFGSKELDEPVAPSSAEDSTTADSSEGGAGSE